MKVANANTSASTLNVNSLGTKNILNPDASSLSSGQLASGSLVMVVYDGTQFILLGGSATTTSTQSYNGFKNRIINGAMAIDQRNAGASVSPTTSGTYVLDRWNVEIGAASKFSVQQTPSATETGYATRVAAGFTSYLACTSLSAFTLGATDSFDIQQRIEGFNTADLAWGTSSAKTITLSFWAYSSLTGTFGGSLRNSGSSRSYPFTYTISSANTWTQISITIAGDTSGTWIGATNGIGLTVAFSIGMGTSYSGTAGAWASANYGSATGAVSVVSTNGATFYITGVQLEKGSTATSFDYRPYGTELALCQRYYQQFAALGNVANLSFVAMGSVQAGGTSAFCMGKLNQTMRSAPSFSYSGTLGTDIKYNISSDATPSSISSDQMNPDNFSLSVGVSGSAGFCCRLISFTNSGQFKFSSEL
jgi:hypothetical protein